MESLLTLLVTWGDPATWAVAYGEVADMREFRKQSAQLRDVSRQHAQHLDKTAEEARLRAIERGRGLIDIANGLREHAPELLGMVPVVDIFEPPEDLKKLAAAMRNLEGALRAKVKANGTVEQAASNRGNTVEPPVGFVPLSAVLGDVGGDYSKANRVISTAGIATWKPTPKSRRLYVNAAEWLNHFEQSKPTAKAIEKFMEGSETRKAAIKKDPIRKSKQLPQK